MYVNTRRLLFDRKLARPVLPPRVHGLGFGYTCICTYYECVYVYRVEEAEEVQAVLRVEAVFFCKRRYRGYSKVRTRTTLGSYSRPMPSSIGSP